MKVAICAWPLSANLLAKGLKEREWDVVVKNPGDTIGDIAEFFDGVDCLLFCAGATTESIIDFCQGRRAYYREHKTIATIRWWLGTDVLTMFNNSPLYNIILPTRGKVTKEIFVSHGLRTEMLPLGFNGDIIPMPTPIFCYGEPPPMPEQKSVLCYLPSGEEADCFYCKTEIQKLYELLPDDFKMIVVGGGEIEGAENLGQIDLDMMRKIYEKTTILYRATIHDGLPNMIMEATSYGRHIIYNHPYPYTLFAASAKEAKRHIDQLAKMNLLGKTNAGMHNMAVREYAPHRLFNIIQAIIANAVMQASDRVRDISMLYQGQKRAFYAKTPWIQGPPNFRG